MPKKIKFESFVYHFLIEANATTVCIPPESRGAWKEFVRSLRFEYQGGQARIAWTVPAAGEVRVPFDGAQLYVRGDTPAHRQRQHALGLLESRDGVEERNRRFFREVVEDVARRAGFAVATAVPGGRLAAEEQFHDEWAAQVDIAAIDVVRMNEVCTAPEMRYIRQRLGDLRGKQLLDVGCGLGEASTYFALQGAHVTALDLSQGMLDAAARLAAANGVAIRTHKSAAESLELPADQTFDVIYAGNLLHHVDIDATLARLRPHLAPGGMLVTWDPVAYNPLINVYRFVATKVRTPDEHPLRLSDIRTFRRYFGAVETTYFWLSTLLIFVLMVVAQRRSPNQERFWKTVVDEGERWKSLYTPLERLDAALLKYLPFLRPLCWNVVVVAHGTP